MKKIISALLITCVALVVSPVSAETSTKNTHKPHKKIKKAVPAEKNLDAAEPKIDGSSAIDYSCASNNNITIYRNASDTQHIALRWNKRLLRMTSVDTSSGANRFENHHYGLVWIGIPAKGMLLDSKKGKQLANDCHSPDHK